MFLNVLFKYTFEQQRTESYLACLDVWNVCVDYVQGLISSRVPEADVIVPKYRGKLKFSSKIIYSPMGFEPKTFRLGDQDSTTYITRLKGFSP